MADSLGHRSGREDATRWNAREIARRNRDSDDRPLSPVMKTAATACELAHNAAARRRD